MALSASSELKNRVLSPDCITAQFLTFLGGWTPSLPSRIYNFTRSLCCMVAAQVDGHTAGNPEFQY
jgi:hypothetical protein